MNKNVFEKRAEELQKYKRKDESIFPDYSEEVGIRAPYIPIAWLRKFLDLNRRQNIDKVDTEFVRLNVIGSGHESKVISALQFLRLVDKHGSATPKLASIRVRGSECQRNLASIVKEAYTDLISTVALDAATSESLTNFFVQRYNYTYPMARYAARLFVWLSTQAKIPIAVELQNWVTEPYQQTRTSYLSTSETEVEGKGRRTTRAFPKNTLKDALKLAESIQNNNAGQPYNRLDLAKSLDYMPDSSLLRTLIISSGRFGLTSGGYQADKISLTELGTEIVASRSEVEKAQGLKKALYNIKLYKDFFTKFDGHKVPKKEFFKATLNRDYGIPNEDTDECYDMIIRNARELGIIYTIKDAEYFQLELLMPKGSETKPSIEEEQEQEERSIETTPSPIAPTPILQKPRVFISHSKNQRLLAQIERILKFGQFDYEVAEKTESTAIPIPGKTFDLMRNCNCAIINIGADDKEKKADGTYGINQNVLIEVGAAFLLYNKRVVLLTDKRIALPSNLRGLCCYYYEGDELGLESTMELQEALIGFRKTD